MIAKHLKTALTIVALSASVFAIGAQAAKEPGKGVTVRPVEAPNLSEKFQHQILYRALEELGYKVAEPEEVNYQTMHLALGTGDGDFTAVHWDVLHHAFFEESGGAAKMTKVGTYIAGALQGYLVDKASYKAGVKNIADLKDAAIAKRFDADANGTADLAGCPPGWGCERVIEHHLPEYGLRDTVTHNQGEYDVIMADTIARLKDGKSVIYYTWTPYWVSGVLVPGENVEWIEVPYSSLPDGATANTKYKGRNLGFAVDNLRVLANNKFLTANPAAAKLFEVATLDINDVSAQNSAMQKGDDSLDDIARHVDAWIKKNRVKFDGWLKAARAAG